ncbi:MAG TPA: OsmC family protein [Anaerolineales bacterium]|nr:OsmC family protein [Anaerolineales bacterium]
MDAKVNLKERMTFVATADKGYEVLLDTGPDAGGDDRGFEPIELLAMGMAGCTAMDVISILRKKQQNITDFEVSVHVDRAEEHPKVFTRAQITYVLKGHDLQEAALARAIELSVTKYCPVQAMFGKLFPIEMRYQIFEGNDSLVKEGAWQPTV